MAQPVTAPPQPTCATCKYSVFTAGKTTGECHRYPPAMATAGVLHGHPLTTTDNWCGEWVKAT